MDVFRTQLIYEFEGFRLDLGHRTLVRPSGERVDLSARLFDTLLYLVERRGQIVDKDTLISAVWPNVVVEENSLSQAISTLRRALGDSRGEHRFIATESGRGYRFVPEIRQLTPPLAIPAEISLPLGTEPHAARTVGRARSTTAKRAASAAVAVAVAAAVAVGMLGRDRGPVTTPAEYVQLTNFADAATAPALSPDGRLVAFIRGGPAFLSGGEIYVQSIAGGDAVRLTRGEQRTIYAPAFTPDGARVAYTVLEDAKDVAGLNTWAVPVAGGEPTRMLPNASGLTWIGPHTVLYSEIESGVHMGVVTATEQRGEHRAIYFPEHQRAMAHYSFLSPDRRQILLVEMDRTGQWQPCRLVPFDGSSAGHSVGPAGKCTSAAWSPDNRWMYLGVEVDGQSHLWRQRYPDGVPEQITFGPSQEEGIALLPDGRSLITSLGVEQNTVWIHDSQGDRQLTSEGFASSPQLSTDGTRLYYLRRGGSMPSSYAFWEPSGAELWSLELASGRKEPRLTGTAVKEYAVSRDGENVAFTTERNGKSEIWLAPLDRRAPPRLLVDDADQPGFGAGGRLLFRSLGASSNYLAAVDVGSSTAPQRVLDAPILNFVSASPDGQSLVVFMKRGELAETVVIDLSDGREMPLGLGLFNARWSADGRHFYVPLEKREPGTVGRTLAIPLAPGTSPANSWRDRGGTSYAATASSWPDAQVLEHTVSFPGADGSSYVFMQPERKRNLFRIPLH